MKKTNEQYLQELKEYIDLPYDIDHWQYYLRSICSEAPELLVTIIPDVFSKASLEMKIATIWMLGQLQPHISTSFIENVFVHQNYVYDALDEHFSNFLTMQHDVLIKIWLSPIKSFIRLVEIHAFQEYILLSEFGQQILKPYFAYHTEEECSRVLHMNMSKVFLGWERRLPENNDEKAWLTNFHIGGYRCAEERFSLDENTHEIPLLLS